MPRMEPLYPVERMVLSRTMTAPTYLRGQVERDATTSAICMKYSSQGRRSRIAPYTMCGLTVGSHLLYCLACRKGPSWIERNPPGAHAKIPPVRDRARGVARRRSADQSVGAQRAAPDLPGAPHRDPVVLGHALLREHRQRVRAVSRPARRPLPAG